MLDGLLVLDNAGDSDDCVLNGGVLSCFDRHRCAGLVGWDFSRLDRDAVGEPLELQLDGVLETAKAFGVHGQLRRLALRNHK